MNQKKKEELVNEMLNKQLAFVGKTVDDVRDEPEWYSHYTITEEQYEEWRAFCLNILNKKFRYTKKRAEYEFSFMNLMWGLKVIPKESTKE